MRYSGKDETARISTTVSMRAVVLGLLCACYDNSINTRFAW